jgi:hypothetical protein
MDFELKEQKFRCPYCTAEITVLLDPSVPEQLYYEDCEVCCHAVEISYAFSDGQLVYFQASSEE